MLIRIITGGIMLFVVYMGVKQGAGMVSGKRETVAIFEKFDFSPTSQGLFGLLTIASALFILFPRSYVLGNILMATSILVIMCLHLAVKDVRMAALEIPFLLLNLVLIYFGYPVSTQK